MSETAKDAAKEKKTSKAAPKKTAAPKKVVTKKAAAPKKEAKKISPKKAVKAAAKAKPSKKATKVPKATKKSVKKTTKSTKSTEFSKFEKFVAEAIAALATTEKQFVSASKIKQYVFDYMEGGLAPTIPKLTKNAIGTLQAKKLIKAKKDSYSFTSKGKEVIAPAKVEKRRKVERALVAKKKKVKVVEQPAKVKTIVTLSGRTSRSVA
jgi:hypothetical protein